MLLGCVGSDVFLCEGDAGCQQGDVSGVCQASGYCSFPDDECPSGQRYGAHAGGELADTCVEPELLTGDPSTSTADAGPDAGPDTDPPVTSTTSSPTTGVDGPVTTEPVDASDTLPGSSTSGMSDDDPGTSAGGIVCWVDDFEDGSIDPMWCPDLEPGILLDEPSGHLRFALDPMQWGIGDDGVGLVTTCETFSLAGAEAAAELIAVPAVSPYTEVFVEMGTEELGLGLAVQNAELYAFVWNGGDYDGVTWQPYVPEAQRWLRVRGDEEGLHAEHSHDGMTWVHVYTRPADLVGLEGTATLGVWGEMVPLGADEARFEIFELCTQP